MSEVVENLWDFVIYAQGLDGDEKGEEYAGTKSVFPSDLPDELAQRIRQVAIDAFNALRLRDYARVDLRVTSKEEIYVIEVNPNCYLEQGSEFASAAAKDRCCEISREIGLAFFLQEPESDGICVKIRLRKSVEQNGLLVGRIKTVAVPVIKAGDGVFFPDVEFPCEGCDGCGLV